MDEQRLEEIRQRAEAIYVLQDYGLMNLTTQQAEASDALFSEDIPALISALEESRREEAELKAYALELERKNEKLKEDIEDLIGSIHPTSQ